MISYSSSTSAAAFTCLSLPKTLRLLTQQSKKHNQFLIHNPSSSSSSSSSSSIRKPNTFVCLRIGVQEIAEIAHNKVLVAAAVSAAIGQLSKPFTSALLYDNDIDFKQFIRAGGFPSTHSAGVVAAATSLGLERGFSDSIFGAAVVFAGIVMYDAQGVRREVGNHAKVLNNNPLLKTQNNSIPYRSKDGLLNMDSNSRTSSSSINSESLAPLLSSVSEKKSPNTPNTTNPPFLRKENITSRLGSSPSRLTDDNEVSNEAYTSSVELKESIGHTEIEVIAGALLGFLVTVAVYSIL